VLAANDAKIEIVMRLEEKQEKSCKVGQLVLQRLAGIIFIISRFIIM
jgi:hypothetical protein